MKYKSTNGKSKEVSFKEAVVKGLADDGGLFFPIEIPKLPESFFKKLPELSISEIAYTFLKPYVDGDLSDDELKTLLFDALNFDIPLIKIKPNSYSLELFHGPTLAFKDVGARIMARFLSKFIEKDKKLSILVATSGDTGSAVANGFLDIEGIDVVVLYPKGMVSDIQEKQFTTLGKNITALEVNGTFDDCQSLVKSAFADEDLNEKLQLSSANSINIARFLPQAIYYFYAYAQLKDKNKPVVFSVPSGNYGNLTSGLIAKKSGLPIHKFIAAANVNAVVTDYLKTGDFLVRPSISTISNAMDVGNPSNFIRIMELHNHSWEKIKTEIKGYSFNDKKTKQCISDVYNRYNYLLDPHGAVAYLGLLEYMKTENVNGIFFETAHPAKFKEIVEKQIPIKINMPKRLEKCLSKNKKTIKIENSLNELKKILINR